MQRQEGAGANSAESRCGAPAGGVLPRENDGTVMVDRAKLAQMREAYNSMKENVSKVEQMSKSQTAVLRKFFSGKMKEKDSLVSDMLEEFRKSNLAKPLEAFTSRNAR